MMEYLAQLKPETIIFGGLTLVALALVLLTYKMAKYYYNHTNDVINRNSDSFVELSKSNERLVASIDKLGDKIVDHYE